MEKKADSPPEEEKALVDIGEESLETQLVQAYRYVVQSYQTSRSLVGTLSSIALEVRFFFVSDQINAFDPTFCCTVSVNGGIGGSPFF